VIRRLVPAAAFALRPGGWLLLEMAIDQGDAVLGLLADGKWDESRVRDDLTGRPRVVEARRTAGEG
jgi:release factor glutamine methyltransferase